MNHISRTIKSITLRLEAAIERNDLYEAEQLFKLLASRYTALNSYSEAFFSLERGFNLLCERGEYNGAAGLGTLMIQNATKGKIPCDVAMGDRLVQMGSRIKESEKLPRTLFLKDAIKYSKSENHPNGIPALHTLIAKTCFIIGDFSSAQEHFVFSDDVTSFLDCLLNWSEMVREDEDDLIITRAVLICLYEKRVEMACSLFEGYVNRCLSFNGVLFRPPFVSLKTPLYNAIHFILALALCGQTQSEKKQLGSAFQNLKTQYKNFFARDPNFDQLLVSIGEKVFGVPPPNTANSFASFLGGMFRGK